MLPLHAALSALPARALRRLLPPAAARFDGSWPGAAPPPGPSPTRGLATGGPPQQQETDHTKSAPFWIVGGMIAVALTASAMKRRLASQEARGELARRANDSLDAQAGCACRLRARAFLPARRGAACGAKRTCAASLLPPQRAIATAPLLSAQLAPPTTTIPDPAGWNARRRSCGGGWTRRRRCWRPTAAGGGRRCATASSTSSARPAPTAPA